MVRSLLFIFLLTPLSLLAQFTYKIENDINVLDSDGKKIPMPWAGGINAAQYSTMDLDGDTKTDLVLFDRMANKVLTYRNINSQFIYSPQFEDLFPSDISNFLLLRDYNCDGKKDIFTKTNFGIKVYTNTTLPGENLSWKHFTFYAGPGEEKSNELLTLGLSGLVNMQILYDDLPSISDVDNDGDLDIFIIQYQLNNTIEFHKNFSIENFGSCDSLAFERITKNYGNVTECSCGQFAFNGAECPVLPGGRVEHPGGKSLTAIDADGDGDQDILFSESTCTTLYLLKNDGTTQDPVINSSSSFPSTNPASFRIFPAGYYEDVDFDNVPDIITSPNIYGKDYLNSNLSASSWFYKNMGTLQSPNFVLNKRNFLQDQMIDVGDNAVPAFADEDGDGDLDLFISENFINATTTSLIFFYENIGTASQPEFKLRTNDYFQFSASNFLNLKIQFADMNGDAKQDLVFTASTFDDFRPVLYYVLNKASKGLNFSGQFAIPTAIQTKYDENIYVTDLGGKTDGSPDGKPDLLIGRQGGSMEYWENDGTLNFTLKVSEFLGIKGTVYRQNPSCAIGDLDADGKPDFVLSDQTGRLQIISDYKKNDNISNAFSDIVLNPLLDSTYTSRNLGGRCWPAIVNLFQTDKPAIVVGNILGGLQILRNDGGVYLPEAPVIRIYPNPVESSALLSILVDRRCSLQVFSSVGQQINKPLLITGNQLNTYSVSGLAQGIYLFRFTFEKKIYTKRIAVN